LLAVAINVAGVYGWYMQRTSATRHTDEIDSLTADAEALNAAVSELVRVYQFRDRDQICCYDISVTQCYALEALADHGPMRSQALAGRLLLDKSTTTRVVDALERKKYVERLPDPADARALSLRITGSGRALVDKIKHELVAQHAQLLADLDPQVRSRVTDVIRRLARAAQARFVSGVSVGGCAPSCGTSSCD
jgi:MarR family 2-MHQ and catechol resistance regulon transcriptional repressor